MKKVNANNVSMVFLMPVNFQIPNSKSQKNNKIQITKSNHDIELLISDIVMPDKEGIELFVEIKESFPDLPIIAISGTQDYLKLAEGLDVSATLLKPIKRTKLISTIEKLI